MDPTPTQSECAEGFEMNADRENDKTNNLTQVSPLTTDLNANICTPDELRNLLSSLRSQKDQSIPDCILDYILS